MEAKFEEIVKKSLDKASKDLQTIDGLGQIDFIDIFPTCEQHRIRLDQELMGIAKIAETTERGNVYILNEPLMTIFGPLKFVKIRIFDATRLKWGAAADFSVANRSLLLNKVGKDSRFSYLERPEWTAIEFKTDDALVYFLEPLASEVYGI